MTRQAFRGRVLDFRDDPAQVPAGRAHRYFADGALLVENGLVVAAGPADELLGDEGGDLDVVDHRPHLLLPGFIDAHIHLPQTQVIASYGAQLLDWLETYTFVEEARFADPAHAAGVARFFLDELLRCGTTTAAVFGSVHAASIEAFFAESAQRNTRMIAGKVLMDRNAPDDVCDSAEAGAADSAALIARWHGNGRQLYAVTPRFAVTSSEAQLEAAGQLLAAHPSCYLQTHLSENSVEIDTVAQLFPWARDYTDVYDRYGLLGPKSLFGHCLHLGERELQRLHDSSSVAVFCPTSNLFIGSGLFDLARLSSPSRPVRVAVATDVGGGTSYSMLRTLAEGYKVLQLQGQNLSALDGFYRMTLGNARALSLEGTIGSFVAGAEADFVVLDSRATPAAAHRMETVGALEEELFVLMTLGDERSIRATYVMGERRHQRGDAGAD